MAALILAGKMMKVTIRPAEYVDAAEIHRVFLSAIRAIDDSYYNQAQRDAWEAAILPESWPTRMLELRFIVAEFDGEIVGFASWSETVLEHIYVVGIRGRKGIGSALIESVLENFRDKEVGLIASNNAVSFYARFGFIEEERLIKQLGSVGVPCIRMKRPVV